MQPTSAGSDGELVVSLLSELRDAAVIDMSPAHRALRGVEAIRLRLYFGSKGLG
jgi:hypothetical protein